MLLVTPRWVPVAVMAVTLLLLLSIIGATTTRLDFPLPSRLGGNTELRSGSSECGLFAAPYGPAGAVYDPETNEVFVADSETNDVYVISVSNLTVTKSISMGPACVNPFDLLYNSTLREVFVTEAGAPAVAAISDISDSIVATYPVPGLVIDMALDTALNELFVTETARGNVSVISLSTGFVTGNISLGEFTQPWGITYVPSLGEMFVADSLGNRTDTLNVISDAGQSVLATVDVSSEGPPPTWGEIPYDVLYDPSSGIVYTSFETGNGLVMVSPSSNTQVGTIALGGGTAGLALDPATGEIWAAGIFPSTIYAISDSTDTVVARGAQNGSPMQGVAIDPTTGDVFVPNFKGSTVSVFAPNASEVASIPIPVPPAGPPAQSFTFVDWVVGIAAVILAIILSVVVWRAFRPPREPYQPLPVDSVPPPSPP